MATCIDFLDRHAGIAAWVQAIGAILIIGATALIASRNSREAQRRERIAKHQLRESVVVLARNCLDALDALLKSCPASATLPDTRGNFIRCYAPSDFDIPIDGLATIPSHHIGDAFLINAVLDLRSAMGRIKKHLDDVQGDPVLSVTLEPVRNQRTLVFNAVATILRVVKGPLGEAEISRLAGRA